MKVVPGEKELELLKPCLQMDCCPLSNVRVVSPQSQRLKSCLISNQSYLICEFTVLDHDFPFCVYPGSCLAEEVSAYIGHPIFLSCHLS